MAAVGGAGGARCCLTGTTPIDNPGPGNPTTRSVTSWCWWTGCMLHMVDPNLWSRRDGTSSTFGIPLTSYGGYGAGGGDPAPLLPARLMVVLVAVLSLVPTQINMDGMPAPPWHLVDCNFPFIWLLEQHGW